MSKKSRWLDRMAKQAQKRMDKAASGKPERTGEYGTKRLGPGPRKDRRVHKRGTLNPRPGASVRIPSTGTFKEGNLCLFSAKRRGFISP